MFMRTIVPALLNSCELTLCETTELLYVAVEALKQHSYFLLPVLRTKVPIKDKETPGPLHCASGRSITVGRDL